MKLNAPFFISSRLLPAIKVGEATIQLEPAGETSDGRSRWRWYIDLDSGEEFSGDDLRSGVGGADTQEMFSSLLSFLSAFAEASSPRYRETSENADLFPARLADWAYQNSDEISLMQCEIEETAELIED